MRHDIYRIRIRPLGRMLKDIRMAEMQVGREIKLVHTTSLWAKLRGLTSSCKSLQGLQRFGKARDIIKKTSPRKDQYLSKVKGRASQDTLHLLRFTIRSLPKQAWARWVSRGKLSAPEGCLGPIRTESRRRPISGKSRPSNLNSL